MLKAAPECGPDMIDVQFSNTILRSSIKSDIGLWILGESKHLQLREKAAAIVQPLADKFENIVEK